MRGRLVFGNTIPLITRSLRNFNRKAQKVVLYTSEDCSLCVRFKHQLDSFIKKNAINLNIEVRDITECGEEIFDKYKHDVPVLVANEEIVCKHRFSPILFRRHLVSRQDEICVGIQMPAKTSTYCADAIKDTDDVAFANLENHSYFNCGIGSNLTSDKTIECEAAYMTTNHVRFGAIGSVSRVKNPVLVAKGLAVDTGIPGLIKPQVLVAQGAEQWALEKGFEMCEPEIFETPQAHKQWDRMYESIQRFQTYSETDNATENTSLNTMDTVGGVAINDGICEACVSSGGIVYKRPGRLGHSTHLGAGTWAEKRGDILVAVSSSGCGEALVRTNFCRSLSNAIFNRRKDDVVPAQIIDEWFRSEFLLSSYLDDIPRNHILGGGIVMLQEAESSELLIFHNTPVFPIAYKTRGKVKHIFSILESPSTLKVESYLL